MLLRVFIAKTASVALPREQLVPIARLRGTGNRIARRAQAHAEMTALLLWRTRRAAVCESSPRRDAPVDNRVQQALRCR